MLIKPVQVEPLQGTSIYIAFEDGEKGVVNLAMMAQSDPRWIALMNDAFFSTVKIQPYRAVGWGDDDAHDICADLLYKVLTGSRMEESREELSHARGR